MFVTPMCSIRTFINITTNHIWHVGCQNWAIIGFDGVILRTERWRVISQVSFFTVALVWNFKLAKWFSFSIKIWCWATGALSRNLKILLIWTLSIDTLGSKITAMGPISTFININTLLFTIDGLFRVWSCPLICLKRFNLISHPILWNQRHSDIWTHKHLEESRIYHYCISLRVNINRSRCIRTHYPHNHPYICIQSCLQYQYNRPRCDIQVHQPMIPNIRLCWRIQKW